MMKSVKMSENNSTIPNKINAGTAYKRKVTLSDLYRALLFAPRSAILFFRNKKSKTVNEQFLERLQLAVTEVSACAVCSYAHTKMALELGLSNEEITAFLTGDAAFQRTEEAKALLFAQHYAETRGIIEKGIYKKIIEEYGIQQARIILAAVQLMLMGNMIGLPISALKSRKLGNPYTNSSLGYELGMIFATIFLIPVASLHSFIRWIVSKPNIQEQK